MISSLRFVGLFSFIGLIFAISGCGESPASLSGKVTYKGQTLKGGSIAFVNKSSGGRHFGASIEKDGSYQVPEMVTGEYIVVIDTKSLIKKDSNDKSEYMAKMTGKKVAPGKVFKNEPPKDAKIPEGYEMSMMAPDLKSLYVKIPDEYQDEKTTKLSIKIQKGPQTHNFDLD